MAGFIKILVVAALITFPVVIESCCLDSCCGQSFTQEYVSVEGINVEVRGRPYPTEPAPGASQPSNYAFIVSFYSQFTKLDSPKRQLTMGAYACDPPLPLFSETIDAVFITTNDEMHTVGRGTFPAGEDLYELFEYDPDHTTLLPNFSVPAEKDYVLTFRFILSDGREFEVDLDPVKFLPEQ